MNPLGILPHGTKIATIEVQIDNTSGRYTFPNDNFLNGKRIVGASLIDNTADDATSNSGRDIVPNSVVANSHLTIRTGSDADVLDVPLKFFQESTGDRSVRPLNIKCYNPGTTFISINGTITAGESIEITLYYQDN